MQHAFSLLMLLLAIFVESKNIFYLNEKCQCRHIKFSGQTDNGQFDSDFSLSLI